MAHHAGKLVRHGIAHGIRQIDRSGTGVDGGLEDLAQKITVAAGAVLGGEFHIVRVAAGMTHRFHGGGQDFFAAHLELVLQVDVGGGDKGVDPGMGGMLDRSPGPVDIRLRSAGQARDLRLFQGLGDGGHGFEVPIRCGWKSRLDDVDAQFFKLLGQTQFFSRVHTGARRLLAVAQRRVEDNHAVRIVYTHGLLLWA